MATEDKQYKVTWFPDDKDQESKTTFSEETALRWYDEANERGFAPFLETRTLTPWSIVRNSVGL